MDDDVVVDGDGNDNGDECWNNIKAIMHWRDAEKKGKSQ